MEDEDAQLVLAALVVLTAVAVSLEILRRLLLARCVAVALLAAVWGAAFPRELQLRATLGALVYHGGAELLRARQTQWKRPRRRRLESIYDGDADDKDNDEGDDASDGGGARDQRVIRSLLFLVRVFVWGATLAAAAGFSAAASRRGCTDDSARIFFVRWWNAVVRAAGVVGALAGYCEALEVLVLLYFADQEVPYRWHQRAPLWVLSCAVGALEVSGLLAFVARRLLARVSPLGLVGVLVAGMWLSIQLPWRRVVALAESVAAGSRVKKRRRSDVLFPSRLSDVDVVEEVEKADDWRYTGHDRPHLEG